jgi:RNA ligase (TIGR02306 family)
MSKFNIPIKRIRAIEPHPNADAIEFAVIDGYRSISRKGQFKPGDLVAYIPEQSLLPTWLLKRLGLWDEAKACGRLTGKEGNRVKAIKLRGALSQGLCYEASPLVDESLRELIVTEGDEVSALLGITKYEPPIPIEMAGEVFNAGLENTLSFDVENIKSYPNVILDGEEVVITEKLHGTCTIVAILPRTQANPEAFGRDKNILIFSKGIGAKGLALKNNERNMDNLYVRATKDLIATIDAHQSDLPQPIFILGETYGPGVQDLSYGKSLGFRAFAVAQGYRGAQRYDDWHLIEGQHRRTYGFATVPVLYRGPFSQEVLEQLTNGKTTLDAAHIREGVIVVPATERIDQSIGRVCLKSVSPEYLTRKGGTEFN